MRFDLTDMRLFVSVVECGSLTHGARAMHLALASVSERIAGMEAALGAPLLERNRRGVRPTAAGETLVRHARSILGQVEQMRGELRTYATGLKGRIRLLSNTAAMAAFLPPQLCRFLAAGMADTALETHLAERAARLGRQLDYRIQLRNTGQVARYVEAGIGISILSRALAATIERDLAVLTLSEAWAARQLYLCARDFSALTPHAGLLARQLLEQVPE